MKDEEGNMTQREVNWKVWLDRALSVAAVVMIAWVVGRYLLPTSGERIGGESIDFLHAGRPVLVEFSQTH